MHTIFIRESNYPKSKEQKEDNPETQTVHKWSNTKKVTSLRNQRNPKALDTSKKLNRFNLICETNWFIIKSERRIKKREEFKRYWKKNDCFFGGGDKLMSW
jgi:hypothetical protein